MKSPPSITCVTAAPAPTELAAVCKVNRWFHDGNTSTRGGDSPHPEADKGLPLPPSHSMGNILACLDANGLLRSEFVSGAVTMLYVSTCWHS